MWFSDELFIKISFAVRMYQHVEQETFTLPEHLTSLPDRSLVFCVIFWRSLFVFLSFFFWSLYCLSFGHCIVCLLVIVLSVFWSLYCLSFGHCIVCLLVIILSVFWSLYSLSFFEIRLLITFFVSFLDIKQLLMN
jgi:hypothetical protein